ncbi:hypothetical protein BV378_00495 [Nostoc sp. RF31YmG]|nr:hypothetical protein BV378_00495 [Nostoc sp. RF31YmG]OUL32075.1 hypothetical protein BV375_10475 [Nostoc sp. 106C]
MGVACWTERAINKTNCYLFLFSLCGLTILVEENFLVKQHTLFKASFVNLSEILLSTSLKLFGLKFSSGIKSVSTL